MSKTNLQAIIVGGGIAGPAAALALRRAGIKAAVYEAHERSDNASGGMSLAPNGMNVLEQLGVSAAVRRAGAVLTDACYRNQEGTVLATHPFGRAETYGQPAVALPRAALHRVLSDALAEAGIPVYHRKRLTALDDVEGRAAVASFEDGSTAEADFIIGADGIHSRARGLILPDGPEPQFVGFIGYGGFVPDRVVSPPDPADERRLNMTFGRSGLFGYCRGSDHPGTWMWWITAARDQAPSRAEIDGIPTDTLRAELLGRCAGWHNPVESFLRHTDAIARVRIFDVQELPAWSRGRVLLIGDAAHAMSPNSGQGASTALEDAVYFAHLMRATGVSLFEVFARFERDRRPRVEKINAEARRTGERKRPIGPVAAWIRDRMFSLLLPRLAVRSLDWKFRYRVPFEA